MKMINYKMQICYKNFIGTVFYFQFGCFKWREKIASVNDEPKLIPHNNQKIEHESQIISYSPDNRLKSVERNRTWSSAVNHHVQEIVFGEQQAL